MLHKTRIPFFPLQKSKKKKVENGSSGQGKSISRLISRFISMFISMLIEADKGEN
ncbi:hypothetical protein PP707_05770 [Acetobacter pasteurianus]|nr:hypothetical protein [Acetobacter pasteurianus]